MEEFLAQTLTDGGELQVAGTPQNEALLSLQSNFPDLLPTAGPAAQVEIMQIYSLDTLYFATNGTLGWADSTGWTGPGTVCGTGGAPWFGVECDAQGVVTSLDLTANDLNGALTSEIRGLMGLRKWLWVRPLTRKFILFLTFLSVSRSHSLQCNSTWRRTASRGPFRRRLHKSRLCHCSTIATTS